VATVADATIARRWAVALLQLASEDGAVDRIGDDLDRFLAAVEAHGGELGRALASPVFTVDERRKVLDATLPNLGLHPHAVNLLRLANDKRRSPLVRAIVASYRDLADAQAGRARVTVETAEPLTPDLERDVRSALESVTGKQVVLRAVVRPELIGGLVARVGDTVYDSSVRTHLARIRQALLTSQIVSTGVAPVGQA
jgi:F-type H+-transporting ATPase subunit delta